jgi:carboxymethylenebutenolidase
VLGLFGGSDPGIPPEHVLALDAALDQSAVEHTVVVYPNAPHSFFDRQQEQFAEASADSWEKVKAFIAKYTPAR